MFKFELSHKPKQPDSDNINIVVLSKFNLLYEEKYNKVLFAKKELPLDYETLKEKFIYLGQLNGTDVYAIELSSFSKKETDYIHARNLLDKIDPNLHSVVFRSLQLSNWDRTSQHCGCCGNKTNLSEKEFVKTCSKCNNLMFPQYSPAVIVRVTRGNEILLGRSYNFEKGMYSTLAGFVESGELCQDAVRREIKEEVGINIKNIKYHSDQPWPFPNSLMIAFTAEYESGELNTDKNELEDAQWFRFDNLPSLPIKSSISYQLIDEFVQSKKHDQQQPQNSYFQLLVNGALKGTVYSTIFYTFQKLYKDTRFNSANYLSTRHIANNTINLGLQSVTYAILNKADKKLTEKFNHSIFFHPLFTAYCSGALIAGIRSLKQKPPHNIHQQALLATSFLGIYPAVKQKVNPFFSDAFLSTIASCGASSTMYFMLLLPTTFYQTYRKENSTIAKTSQLFSLTNAKNCLRSTLRHTLWKAPAIGLAGEISLQLMQRSERNLDEAQAESKTNNFGK